MSYQEDIRKAGAAQLPWNRLSGKNILVVVDVLMARENIDYDVYAAGRSAKRLRERFLCHCGSPNLHFLEHDVTEPVKASVPFDFMIDAAGGASPNSYAADPVGVMMSNIRGVDNLLSYGMGHGMERFLYVSSGEVYGEGDGRVFTEGYSGYVDSMSPRSCYPSAKRASETLCVSYASQYSADVVVARPCHVYGPYFTASDNRVYAQFMRNAVLGEDIVMKSDGSQFRSWCYVVDCASALLHIMLKGEPSQAYNIADGISNVSIRELADIIAEIAGVRVVVEAASAEEKAGFNRVTKSVFSTEKLESLGWSVSGTMREKLKASINALRDV